MTQPIGIVLVSHSPRLAAGLRELLAQIGSDSVPVTTAAGAPDGTLGTSYDLIAAAITEADRGAGVIIIPDLGSSVLTTQAVLEDHPHADVVLVDAPFVEGAVAAAVTSASGADLATVAEAARQARTVVKVHGAIGTGAGAASGDETATGPEPDAGRTASSEVTLPANLHARPAGRLAREAAKFASTIRLEHAGKSVNPTGVLAVMSLGATLGATITVHAEGPDADTAVRALTAILAEVE
ncbi:MAG: HPr family phosphocarrier protein [Catenulispora sp.]|nr:HPr family phosphocarrier protein [Catenulispora sp.]